jgi:two-component system LytT family response regulator
MTNRAWRVVIVDDEPLARQTLRLLLTREADFLLAGESTHAKAAIEAIRTVRPDVVFLDVHMPELDGFAVVPHLDTTVPPLVVFVTAFERHALQAFEAQAFDYLLKCSPTNDRRRGGGCAADCERLIPPVRRRHGRRRPRRHPTIVVP